MQACCQSDRMSLTSVWCQHLAIKLWQVTEPIGASVSPSENENDNSKPTSHGCCEN